MIDKLFSYDTVFWLLLMIMIVAGTVALTIGSMSDYSVLNWDQPTKTYVLMVE